MFTTAQVATLSPGVFGILVVMLLAVAQLFVRQEFIRRRIAADPIAISSMVIISGIVVAKIAAALESPSAFSNHPISYLLHSAGANYYAGLITGILVATAFAEHYHLPNLVLLDVLSLPMGFLALIDRGYPLFGILWLLLAVITPRGIRQKPGKPVAPGALFSILLAFTGLIRFGLSSSESGTNSILTPSLTQITNLICFFSGMALFIILKVRFHKLSKEHRILNDATQRGLTEQPESKSPTPECPHPERWRMYDAMTAEVEVLEFLKTLVTTVKPNLVVETGTFMGVSTLWIAEGLKQNGFGRIITCEFDPKTHAAAKRRFDESGLSEWIDCRLGSSLELQIEGTIDILFSDSDLDLREKEVRRFLPQVNPNGIILMHDASSHLKVVREAALRLEQENLISVLLLPTPRGLVIAQKRAGRK
ncbi:MAG: class I SAM-dependent methyltransferase [Candidatus Acidiferrales bacterium]